MKKYQLIILFLFFFVLSACDETTTTPTTTTDAQTYQLQLNYPDGSLYANYNTVTAGEEISLPTLEEADAIFIGWVNDDNTYYDSVEVVEDMILTASFEAINDVFDYDYVQISDSDFGVSINSYHGDATHLLIPQHIDGLLVVSIKMYAFEASDLIEVWIPNSITRINRHTFYQSESLEAVRFYGDYFGTIEKVMAASEFEAYLDEYADICEVAYEDSTEETVIYEGGCPMIKSTKGESVFVGDVEYVSYFVIVQADMLLETSFGILDQYAFEGATSLKTIEISAHIRMVNGMSFTGLPNLEEIIVHEDNQYYTFEEGILYNKDMTGIIYVPSSTTEDNPIFTVPSLVDTILPFAFYDNQTVEEIQIPETVTNIFSTAFERTPALSSIQVDQANEDYFDIDGVLFEDKSGYQGIVAYPSARVATSYTLPEGVTYISNSAFAYNQYLESIDLGDELEMIGGCAFKHTEQLTVLDIPASIRRIDYDIVKDSSIETVIIRASITEGDLPVILDMFLHSDRSSPDIYVPDDSLSAYIEQFPYNPAVHNFKGLSTYSEE